MQTLLYIGVSVCVFQTEEDGALPLWEGRYPGTLGMRRGGLNIYLFIYIYIYIYRVNPGVNSSDTEQWVGTDAHSTIVIVIMVETEIPEGGDEDEGIPEWVRGDG